MTVDARHFHFLHVVLLLALGTPAVGQDDEAIDIVIELLQDNDKEMRSLAMEQVRDEFKGEAATRRFAAELPELNAAAQAELLSALAARGDIVAKDAVTQLLDAETAAVRLSAIRAISTLGDSLDCARLVDFLGGGKPEKAAAKLALIQIQGTDVAQTLEQKLSTSAPPIQAELIEILASRRAFDSIPKILQAAIGPDAQVRIAAMVALGKIGRPEHIRGMVQGVLRAERGSERAHAERNLAAVCNRIDEEEERAKPLLSAIDELPAKDRIVMLTSLGRVGGAAALDRLEKAIASSDDAQHSAGLIALANWPDSSVSPQLKRLAYEAPYIKHQLIALRALIRVAPLSDGRTDAEKLRALQAAMNMSIRYADRNYALQRASAIRIPETLRWVLPYVDDPNYAEQACQTIVELAHIRDLRDDNKAEFHAALDKVLATSKDATVLDRADRYKLGRTWVRPN